MKRLSAEQIARNMLERMEVDGAQSFSAGDPVELVNLIDAARSFTDEDLAWIRSLAHDYEAASDRDPDEVGAYEAYRWAESLADRIELLRRTARTCKLYEVY